MGYPALERFALERDGEVVALGVIAPQGGPWLLFWLGEVRSIAIYASCEELLEIHGHGGSTRVVLEAGHSRP